MPVVTLVQPNELVVRHIVFYQTDECLSNVIALVPNFQRDNLIPIPNNLSYDFERNEENGKSAAHMKRENEYVMGRHSI